MRRSFVKLVAATFALTAVSFAHAQTYPNKPIRVVLPFPAGLGPDVLMRLVADKMTASMGQAVIVDNKPGAAGFVAFDAAKRAPNDGYTLVLMDNFHIGTQPHLYSKLPYDAWKEFTPVTPLARNFFFVTVPSNSPWKNMGDLIAAAKVKPDAVSYGSWNVASPAHLGGMLLEAATGTQMLHVPFKEAPMLYQAVANGEVNWAIGSGVSAGPLYKAGKLRFLAAAAPSKIAGFTDVPTAAESGAPKGYEVSGWFGVLAPAGTPPAIVNRLNDEIKKAMNAPDIKERLASFTYENYTMSPAQMSTQMDKEKQQWGEVIRKTGLKLD